MAKIIENLPLYYKISDYVKNVSNAYDIEVNLFDNKRKEMKNQFIVDTATTSLIKYEEEYGLDINPLGISIEERRSRIKAKMRSVGTINKETIKSIVDSWTNGNVDIIEDFNNYTFTVKFNAFGGVPTNIEDVKKAIEEVKPAHLIVLFTFLYLWWDKYESYNKTWDEWDNLNKTWDEFEIYIV